MYDESAFIAWLIVFGVSGVFLCVLMWILVLNVIDKRIRDILFEEEASKECRR